MKKLYFEIRYISHALKKHKKNAPMIPSTVFLGDINDAKGLLPIKFPINSPPLSAYQLKHTIIARNLGLH